MLNCRSSDDRPPWHHTVNDPEFEMSNWGKELTLLTSEAKTESMTKNESVMRIRSVFYGRGRKGSIDEASQECSVQENNKTL